MSESPEPGCYRRLRPAGARSCSRCAPCCSLYVHAENRFNVFDPVERLIRVHAESLATALRNRQASETAPASRECDAGQCRIVLNAARREIDRLRRGLVQPAQADMFQPSPHRLAHDVPPDPKASPPSDRKSYAPDPLGKPTEFRDVTPPDPAEIVRVVNYFHVTNLGTLLDVLA